METKFEYVILELSSRCTAGCPGCFRSTIDVAEGDMSREVFEAAVKDIPRGTMVCAALLGESMLNVDYGYFLQRFRELDLHVSVPASALVDKWILELVRDDTPVYSILVSTDGITNHSQHSHRGKITLDDVKHFVTIAQELRGKRKLPYIGVRWVDNGQSEIEFEWFLRYWLRRGVDMVVRARHFDLGIKNKNSTQLAAKCHVLTKNIPAIAWNGDVLLCERVPDRSKYICGNVLRDSWETILARRAELTCGWPVCEPCEYCSAAVVSTGFQGIVELRNYPGVRLYMHSDHYQTFYSLEKNWSGITFKSHDGCSHPLPPA
jgi:hypothetical protein